MGLFSRKRAEPEVIDLRDQVITARATRFEFGFPTRCPACGSRGYLDHLDVAGRIQYEHCPSCWTKWQHSEEEILSLEV